MMGRHENNNKKKTKTMAKRTLLLLGMMAATLVTASGMALAVSKVCPPGSTQANPCAGTKNNDTLLGTGGADYITGLAGNDKISAGGGNDTTDGGAGNDTYSYKSDWGVDTLIDASGTDALNFSAGYGVSVHLTPEFGQSYVDDDYSEAQVWPSYGTVVEKVTGSGGYDFIRTSGGPNTLQPGPGTEGASLGDFGGCTPQSNYFCTVAVPASSDTYSGFAASGYGWVEIVDHGGSADKLVLPFASTDTYFEAWSSDSDPALDSLVIMTSADDEVLVWGQLEPENSRKGHIEQIVFTDETITIGSETASQTVSAEAQVQKLNEASKLDKAEKEKRKEAAKKSIEEAKEKKAQEK